MADNPYLFGPQQPPEGVPSSTPHGMFKPFSIEEVAFITRASPRLLDTWVTSERAILRLQYGFDTYGLDLMQCFAIFVGVKYLLEGADDHRTTQVVLMLANTQHEVLMSHLDNGNNWPVPIEPCKKRKMIHQGVFVPAPIDQRLGRALRLDYLYLEFRANIDRLYPRAIQG